MTRSSTADTSLLLLGCRPPRLVDPIDHDRQPDPVEVVAFPQSGSVDLDPEERGIMD
jgi:hypothetical protein